MQPVFAKWSNLSVIKMVMKVQFSMKQKDKS